MTKVVVGITTCVTLAITALVLPHYFSGEWAIPAGVSFGSFTIRWYGIIQALSWLAGVFVLSELAARRGKDAYVESLILWLLPATYIGARLYYVVLSWAQYADQPWRIFALWEGGLAIHGGILGGAVALWAWCWYKKMSFLETADMLVPGLVLGQAIGRWGNFFNQEAYGTPTDLPWKLFVAPEHRPPELVQSAYFHPTFLYESLWNAGVFLLLWLLWRTKRAPGFIVGMYLVTYSVGRFAIESLRIDSLFIGQLRAAQIVSVVIVIVGAILLWQKKGRTDMHTK